MLRTATAHEVERSNVRPGLTQCISPWRNPAHVLAPPRQWLEGLSRQPHGWAMFRLRYKHLLRKRLEQYPERFAELLAAVHAPQPLFLTCQCQGAQCEPTCHAPLARAFLERTAQRQRSAEPDGAGTPVAVGATARRPAMEVARTLEAAVPAGPARTPRPARRPAPLAQLLVEHPHAARAATG